MKIITHKPTFVSQCAECPYLATRFRAGCPSMRVPAAIRYRCWAAQGPAWLDDRLGPTRIRMQFRERFTGPGCPVIIKGGSLERLIGDESSIHGIPAWCPLPDAPDDTVTRVGCVFCRGFGQVDQVGDVMRGPCLVCGGKGYADIEKSGVMAFDPEAVEFLRGLERLAKTEGKEKG